MQKIFLPKKSSQNEGRVAVSPATTKKLIQLGFEITVECGAGLQSGFLDRDYEQAGAKMVTDRGSALKSADIVLCVRRISDEEIRLLKPGTIHISLLNIFDDQVAIELFKTGSIKAISLEMIPRISVAQKMDVLSSQASLAGYAAVIHAAERIRRAFPMMITAAGTIFPVKVFIIGAGVAGLQAIATAKRLGAVVEAFDTRPEVADQVHSLGAKFLKIDLGTIEKGEGGYARELSDEQLVKQKNGMLDACKRADIVITTAKVFGCRPPVLIDRSMLEAIDSSTLIIDMAGGNVEDTVAGEEVQFNEYVTIVGMDEAEQYVSRDASNMFAENVYNFIEHFRSQDGLFLDQDDEILNKCLIK